MRLPLRHPPSRRDAPSARCAYLEELAEAALGLPLAAAGDGVAARGGRGRHGAALQWHFGLEPHDGRAVADWENRIEIKLVSVWGTGSVAQGRIACDKLKVCDVGIDPWSKLATTLWVFADRMTRVVLGHRFTDCAGEFRRSLESSWGVDPHFEHPDLFVEPRSRGDSRSPAYYISAGFLAEHVLVEHLRPTVFDPRWWAEQRKQIGSEPRFTVVDDAMGPAGRGLARCEQCTGQLSWDSGEVTLRGWARAEHLGTQRPGSSCSCRAVVHAALIPAATACSPAEQRSAMQGGADPAAQFRLADRVLEPPDHLH